MLVAQWENIRTDVRRLALVHEVSVHAAALRVLEDRLEDRLQVRERLDLGHEVHQVRILFCETRTLLLILIHDIQINMVITERKFLQNYGKRINFN